MSDFGHDETDKELKQLEARISAEYKVAAADLELKMNKYLSDFARKDEMMKKDMQAGKMSEDDYLIWRRNQIIIGKRWETMLDSVTKDMVNADKLAASMINKSLPNVYAQNMNYGTYEVESGTRIDTGFTLYDRSTVENLLKEDPHIIKFAKIDEEKDERWNKKKIESAVLQGILQGESMPKIASRLKSVADMGDNAAIRNARTYTTAAENKGRMDSYERCQEMGIKMKKKWIATLDDRTRVEHRHLDEMVADIDEPFKTDGYEIMYPGDPEAEGEMIYNCRCTLVSEIPGIMYDDKRYDEKLGDMTYEEWKHAKDRKIKPKEEPQEETKKSFAELLIDKEYSPHIMGYSEVEDYWAAKKEYKEKTGNERTEYLEDLQKLGVFEQETIWHGGEYYNDKIPRIEATIVEMEKEYPMLATGDFEYGGRLKYLCVGDYDYIHIFLPDGENDRRLTEGAAGQVFKISNTSDPKLGEHDIRAVIGFNRDYLFTTVEQDIEEREKAIKNGESLLEIGSSPEIVAIHEWGHITSEHIDNAFINSDETVQAYWEWYKSLTKEEIAAGLSSYATTNRGEFEAECFAELHMPNPRPIALKFKEYLDEIIEKGY